MTSSQKFLLSRRRAEFLLSRRRFRFEYFCERCQAETFFVSLEDAVAMCGLTMREIVRAADSGAIHFLESRGEHLVVCQNSLPVKTNKAAKNLNLKSEGNFL